MIATKRCYTPNGGVFLFSVPFLEGSGYNLPLHGLPLSPFLKDYSVICDKEANPKVAAKKK